MPDVNIKGVISVETAAAAANILELKGNIAKLKDELKNSEKGSHAQTEAFVNLNKAQKDLSQASKDYTETLKEKTVETNKSSEAFGILKGKVQGLVPGLAGAESGIGSFGKALKILAMNPIMLILTAIVAVLTFVYEAFNNTSAGAKKTGQVFAGITAVLGVLKDAAFILGRSLIDMVQALMAAYDAAKKFLSFDFAGAKKSWEEAKNHAKDVGNEVAEAAALATKALSGQIQAQGEAIKKQAQSATGALENSARLRSAKREIARILTVKTERERLGKI